MRRRFAEAAADDLLFNSKFLGGNRPPAAETFRVASSSQFNNPDTRPNTKPAIPARDDAVVARADASSPAMKDRLALATQETEVPPRKVIASPPIIIGHSLDDHDGGDIEVFAEKYERIKKSGRKVVIDGLCFSACTIVASLPKDQVCVTPNASLGVHLAADDDGPDVEYTERAVKKYYPKALQDWIKQHGGLQERPKYVKGKDLLAIFGACRNQART